jgi:hypothetical protein
MPALGSLSSSAAAAPASAAAAAAAAESGLLNEQDLALFRQNDLAMCHMHHCTWCLLAHSAACCMLLLTCQAKVSVATLCSYPGSSLAHMVEMEVESCAGNPSSSPSYDLIGELLCLQLMLAIAAECSGTCAAQLPQCSLSKWGGEDWQPQLDSAAGSMR